MQPLERITPPQILGAEPPPALSSAGMACFKRGSEMFAVIEMVLYRSDYLIVFVSLTGYEKDVAPLENPNHELESLSPILDYAVSFLPLPYRGIAQIPRLAVSQPGKHILNDRMGIFSTRVIRS
jgi:hypothetical protein